MVIFIQWIPDFKLSVSLNETVFNLVINRRMNDQSSCRSTSLPGSSYSSEYSSDNGHIQIRMFGDNDGIVSAKFQDGFSETLSHLGSYHSSDTGRAGKGYKRCSFISNQFLTDRMIANDHS